MHTHLNTMSTQDGFFPLYVASQEGHDRIVEMFLQAGATVDLQNKVDNYYYLIICHLCCAMCCNQGTLSTTNIHSNVKDRDYIQHIAIGIQFKMNKFICALEACTFGGLGMCFPKTLN